MSAFWLTVMFCTTQKEQSLLYFFRRSRTTWNMKYQPVPSWGKEEMIPYELIAESNLDLSGCDTVVAKTSSHGKLVHNYLSYRNQETANNITRISLRQTYNEQLQANMLIDNALFFLFMVYISQKVVHMLVYNYNCTVYSLFSRGGFTMAKL